MTAPRESQLHQFSLLLNASTAAAKIAQALGGRDAPPEWAEAAKAISAELLARDGEPTKIPPLVSQSYRDPSAGKPSYDNHPLTSPASGFASLTTAVRSLSGEQVEEAAAAIAKQLAVPFEKDGVPHIGFPHQGNGLKIRRRKGGALEVFDWSSDWGERLKIALPKYGVYDNSHAKYDNQEALEKLTADERVAIASMSEYLRALPPMRSAPGSLGEFPTRGIHAAGKLAGSANTEEPIASLRRDSTKLPRENSHWSAEASAAGLHSGEDFYPSARRLGWAAIALLLGDRLALAEAASAHCAPNMKAQAAMLLEVRPKTEPQVRRGHGDSAQATPSAPFPGSARARRPATCAIQAACALFSASMSDYGNVIPLAERIAFMPYSPTAGILRSDRSKEMLADQDLAKAVVQALDAKSKIIMDRAYELAGKIEADWLCAHGLDNAIEDAKLLGAGKVSAKSLNWALANPDAAEGLLQAADHPELGFAAKSARYLGLRADGAEQTVERAKAAWSQRGLGADGFAGASASKACADLLSQAWTAELEEKKRERKPGLRARLDLAACSLQAAFAEGASAAQARSFAQWCAERPAFFIPAPLLEAAASIHPNDPIHPDMPEREVGLAADAKELSQQARAREAAHPAAMKAVFRAYAFGEDMPSKLADPQASAQRMKLAESWLAMAAKGAAQSPAIDWAAGVEEASLRDLAHRTTGSLGKAMHGAAKDGPHGAFAARVAMGLGIDSAQDANDLVAKVREKLRQEFGMGDAGWKSLGKAPQDMVEHLAGEIEKRSLDVLESRAKQRELLLASSLKSQGAVGLGLALLSGAAHFGLDLKDAALIEALGRARPAGDRSELLRHGIRPIKAGSAQSADFAHAEALAKAERLPRIAKTMAEKAAKSAAELIAGGLAEPDAKKQAARVLAGDIALIDDWLKDSEDGVWQTLPAKAGFSDLMRRQAVWHEDTAARAAAGQTSGKAAKGWAAPLLRHADGEWRAVLLGTADELTEEGRAMRHCVSSYSGHCKQGASRIYSVRLNGERVSTLELKLTEGAGSYKAYDHQHPSEGDRWKPTQNNGKCNAAIKDPSALAFCAEVADLMNAAHIHWCEELSAKRSAIAQQAAATRKSTQVKMG